MLNYPDIMNYIVKSIGFSKAINLSKHIKGDLIK